MGETTGRQTDLQQSQRQRISMSDRTTSETQGARVLIIDDDKGGMNALRPACATKTKNATRPC